MFAFNIFNVYEFFGFLYFEILKLKNLNFDFAPHFGTWLATNGDGAVVAIFSFP